MKKKETADILKRMIKQGKPTAEKTQKENQDGKSRRRKTD